MFDMEAAERRGKSVGHLRLEWKLSSNATIVCDGSFENRHVWRLELCSPREERPAGRELHETASSQNIYVISNDYSDLFCWAKHPVK